MKENEDFLNIFFSASSPSFFKGNHRFELAVLANDLKEVKKLIKSGDFDITMMEDLIDESIELGNKKMVNILKNIKH